MTEVGTEYNLHSTIQPYGLLFVVDADNFRIEQVSANVESLLGVEPTSVFDQSFLSLLEVNSVAIAEAFLRFDESVKLQPVTVRFKGHDKPFALGRDNQDTLIVIEAEPLENEAFLFADTSRYLFHVMERLSPRASSSEVMHILALEIKNITGFDRVAVCRFDESNNGVVVAEEKASNMVSYIGFHYSAKDLPDALFKAYLKNPLRYIKDTAYAPCPILSSPNKSSRQVNLISSHLRVLPPEYLTHLRVMKVASAVHFALVCDGRLWGLVICQNRKVKHVDHKARSICETLANALAVRLSAQLESEDLEIQLKSKTALDNICKALEETQEVEAALLQEKDNVLHLFNCEGSMVVTEKGASILGTLPNDDTLQKTIDWLNEQQIEDYFATESLNDFIDAHDEVFLSPSLLAIKLPATENEWILCFRREKPVRITWVGAPPPQAKPVGSSWLDIARDNSGVWQQSDLDNAKKLRSRMAEIRLKRLVAQLSEANKLHAQREEFISCLAHDLKAPVVGAVRILQVLKDQRLGELKDEHRDIVDSLINGHGELLEKINTLLVAYKYDTIGIKLNLSELDENEFVRRCIDKVKDSAVAHEIDIVFCPSESPAMIMAEEESLQRVVDNLLDNAIKFSKPGSPILVSVQSNETDVFLKVCDTAGGIPLQDQPYIFRRFWQGIPGKRYAAGTGLGLYICQKIVRLHGGTISFTSDDGKGTTFEVSLPKYVAMVKRNSKELSLS